QECLRASAARRAWSANVRASAIPADDTPSQPGRRECEPSAFQVLFAQQSNPVRARTPVASCDLHTLAKIRGKQQVYKSYQCIGICARSPLRTDVLPTLQECRAPSANRKSSG